MKLICKRELTDTRDKSLFTKKVTYDANEMKNDFVQIKDNTGCTRYLPKQVWREHFKVVEELN